MSIDTGTLVALGRHWETSLISSANDFVQWLGVTFQPGPPNLKNSEYKWLTFVNRLFGCLQAFLA